MGEVEECLVVCVSEHTRKDDGSRALVYGSYFFRSPGFSSVVLHDRNVGSTYVVLMP
jgi:hypothetical protein